MSPRAALALALSLGGCVPQLPDLDGDGFRDVDDCAELDITVHPDAPEVCDRIDNDCDGEVDEGFFVDLDRDGFGVQPWDCDPEVPWAPVDGDCDDGRAAVNPGLVEAVYNGVDDDCDPLTTDDDLDGDGYGFTEDCDDQDPGNTPEGLVVYDGSFDWPSTEDWSDVQHVTGRIFVEGTATDFEGLEGLCRVDRGLYGDNAGGLRSYAGLEGLVALGYLHASYGADVPDMSGLESLVWTANLELSGIRSVAGMDSLRRVDRLSVRLYRGVDLTGLEHVGSIGQLHVSDVDALVSLRGLPPVPVYDAISLYGTHLVDLEGLESVRLVDGDLTLTRNRELSDLTALHGIRSITGDVSFEDNFGLSDEAIAAFIAAVGEENIGGEITIE